MIQSDSPVLIPESSDVPRHVDAVGIVGVFAKRRTLGETVFAIELSSRLKKRHRTSLEAHFFEAMFQCVFDDKKQELGSDAFASKFRRGSHGF